jgi:uncharacterized protein (TIGR02118 family)
VRRHPPSPPLPPPPPLVKLVLLFKKREDLSTEAFLRHWREVHVPLVLQVPDIRRYVISPVIGAPLGEADCDGMAELWFESEAIARRALDSPATRATAADARNFIQRGSIRRFFCEEEPVVG